MTRNPSHNELRELLAAYALDAVDGDEAAAVGRHLRDCPRCRAEVVEHRETVAALATGHEPVPVRVWDSVVTELDAAPDTMQHALEERTVLAAVLAANGDPDARQAELRSSTGVVLARAVLVPDGTGYLWSEGLPRTGSDRTYQLWAIVGTERISAGVLGPRPTVAPFKIAGDVAGMAITEEVAGGVVASENQPVASGLVVEA